MIRTATAADASGISRLLTQLGYPGTEGFLGHNLERMLSDPREILLVWADSGGIPGAPTQQGVIPDTPPNGDTPGAPSTGDTITGFLSMEISIYPSLSGPVAAIKAFAVDENARSSGIGAKLEAEATKRAREKGSDRIIVHCAERRKRAHEFYFRQGYHEDPKYLIKSLL